MIFEEGNLFKQAPKIKPPQPCCVSFCVVNDDEMKTVEDVIEKVGGEIIAECDLMEMTAVMAKVPSLQAKQTAMSIIKTIIK